MARPVRVDVANSVYHVVSRGTERCDLFREDEDRVHFLDRLAKAQRRFRLSVYGYALMDNHFHLIACTPEANLSQAMQWLKMSYSMWFNKKQQRVGPLFQSWFKGVLVDPNGSWLLELSLYVCLNPVRIRALGLGKNGKPAEALGWLALSPEVAAHFMPPLPVGGYCRCDGAGEGCEVGEVCTCPRGLGASRLLFILREGMRV